MAKIILGLAGEIASGKGTVAEYVVEKYGGSAHRFSTMLRDILDRLYLEHSRENTSKISTVLRQNFGEDVLAKIMREEVQRDACQVIIVEGIRRVADIEYLKELPEFKFIYVEADINKRYERLIQRGENVDDKGKTFEQFEKDHQLETELQIKDLKNHADFVIYNGGDIKGLEKQVDKIINQT